MITRNGKPAAVVVSADWYVSAETALGSTADGPGMSRKAGRTS
jgi:PHD/YefM family antitoxin component YafN of YafNO toxin-antitoxin module